MNRIYHTVYQLGPDENKVTQFISGWRVEGEPGIFNTFAGALASSMGLWDEYCDYHR